MGDNTPVLEAEQSKESTKLEHSLGHLRVLIDDLSYLMLRIDRYDLASIDEHREAIEEIHDAQRILANCESLAQVRISELAIHRFMVNAKPVQERLK